jgi:phosphoglycolate phosphatase-like HAD superfamily hydrolase
MPSNKKLIIFDLDGVLVDTSETASQYLLDKYPTFTKEIVTDLLIGNYHEELAKLELVHAHIVETAEEKAARKEAYSIKKSNTRMFDGIHGFLKRLHEKKFILAINTSAVEKNCLPLLEKLEILNLFDFVGTAEVSKSKVEKFKIIEHKYEASNKNTLFVTDTLGDIREAKIAGVPTVAVTWGAHDRSYFTREENENLIAIVDTIEELEKVIENKS